MILAFIVLGLAFIGSAMLGDLFGFLNRAPGWKKNGGPGLRYLLPERKSARRK